MPRTALPTKRVLIVDDEIWVADTLGTVLRLDGHHVEIRSNPHEVLESFQAQAYDLVITDFEMPSMDGLELAQQLKNRFSSTKIILWTARAELIRGTGTPVLNVDVILSKPCSIQDVDAALLRLFENA